MCSGGAGPPLAALPAGAPAVIEIAPKTDNVIKRQQQLPVGSMMTVRGMVQDATFGAASGSGRPASDVAIRCRLILPVEGSRDPRSEELEGVTDETGQFEFEVPEGATLYSIQASGSESHRSAYWSAPLDWREEAGALRAQLDREAAAAEAGLARAQHTLACHYFTGKGAPRGQDFAEAAAWFERAAEGGVGDARGPYLGSLGTLLAKLALEGTGQGGLKDGD